MIGETGKFKTIGSESYIQVNDSGTFEKLPRLPWYKQLEYAVRNAIFGGVRYAEIKDYCNCKREIS